MSRIFFFWRDLVQWLQVYFQICFSRFVTELFFFPWYFRGSTDFQLYYNYLKSPVVLAICLALNSAIYSLLIHFEKLLSSDWLKRITFLINSAEKCNASAKLQRRYPKLKRRPAGGQQKYFEDRWKSPEPFRTLTENGDIRRSPDIF